MYGCLDCMYVCAPCVYNAVPTVVLRYHIPRVRKDKCCPRYGNFKYL